MTMKSLKNGGMESRRTAAETKTRGEHGRRRGLRILALLMTAVLAASALPFFAARAKAAANIPFSMWARAYQDHPNEANISYLEGGEPLRTGTILQGRQLFLVNAGQGTYPGTEYSPGSWSGDIDTNIAPYATKEIVNYDLEGGDELSVHGPVYKFNQDTNFTVGTDAYGNPTITFSAVTTNPTEYPLVVSGDQVSDNKLSGAGWTFAPNTYTLTLSGYNSNGAVLQQNGAAIFYYGTQQLTIALEGTNTITECNTGILAEATDAPTGVVVISGSGNLSITATTAGIETANSLFVHMSGAVTSNGESYGIKSANELIIASGTVKATATNDGLFAPIVNIKGGTVEATGTGGVGIMSEKIGNANENYVHIAGGKVTAHGSSAGIVAAGSSYVSIEKAGDETPEVIAYADEMNAIEGTVKNNYTGTGWTDSAGTQGATQIPVNTDGQSLRSYKRVQFPEGGSTPITATYTIKFAAGDGSGAMDEITIREGESFTLPTTCGFTPPAGKKFAGWYINGTFYPAGTVLDWDTLKALIKDGVITITAAWEDDSIATVTVSPEGKSLGYNGSAQALVTAGEASGGTMLYALGTDATTEPAADAYSAEIPTGTEKGTYYIWYKAKGDETHLDSAAACVTTTITDASLVGITTKSLPDATVGKPYSTKLEADGTEPIKWSVTGNLPAGLKLDEATGTISGTPTAEGVFTFTVKAENTAGSVTKDFTLKVTGGKETKDDDSDSKSACSHVYEWVITKQPTRTEDGVVEYCCRKCGSSLQSQPISAMGVFLKEFKDAVTNAASGATVTITADPWVSVNREVIAAIQARPDVTVNVQFGFQNNTYGLSIPAKTDLSGAFANEQEQFVGFFGLASRTGATVTQMTAN